MTLSIGRVRGLQQISDERGIFAMCAMDHRGSLQRMLNPQAPDSVGYDAMVTVKRDLAEMLGPAATAVLLDPVFGAAQAVAAGALRGGTGLIVSLEETGYETAAHGRVTRLLEGWSVHKARRMGAAAVKVLLYYRPDLGDVATQQRDVVRRVAADCMVEDIPFVLEPVTYPVSAAERDPELFARSKPDLVVRSARELTGLGIDVLKAEFPVDLRFVREEGAARDACATIDAASRVPWVLLSGGVSYDEFVRHVRIACQAGASGFLGGRAVWEDAMRIADRAQRRRWLQTTGADRLRRLRDIAGEHGRPWWRKFGDTLESATDVGPDWYRGYGTSAPAGRI